MPNGLGKIPTPLELADTGADIVNQAVSTVPRVLGNSLSAMGQTFKNLESDLARPREYAEIPPPPGVLVEPAIAGVSHIVGGLMDTVKGAFDGVLATADGIRREVDSLVR